MGNNNSKPPGYNRLYAAIPPLYNHGLESEGKWFDSNSKVWADDRDREQFICMSLPHQAPYLHFIHAKIFPSPTVAVAAVASRNGAINLSEHDFKLLFSRRPMRVGSGKQYKTKDEEIVATLVAMKDGVIEAKIESPMGGKDQRTAFLAFRKEIEVRLESLLQDVPADGGSTTQSAVQSTVQSSTSGNDTPSSSVLPSVPTMPRVPTEAPPAYEARKELESLRQPKKN
ncbi:MAG: hypothetical protein Q9227_004663 [Pyrenula ochraceoflavens]